MNTNVDDNPDDEYLWEEVIDFTAIKENGVSAEELLNLLKK
ncbi:MAG: hypothetical protein Q7S64_02705 [bacterium]|nr:hypothetical protein [bacterium]